MANRSLRRNPGGNGADAGNVSSVIGSAIGSEPEHVSGSADDDTRVNGTVTVDESKPDSVGGVSYVEVDPARLSEYINAGTGTSDGTGTGTSDGTRKRKPRSDAGQPRGGRQPRSTAKETIAPFIEMAHTWAAVFLKTPELQLDPTEVKQLSDAYDVFCKYHDVPIMSPKRMSEIQLIGAMGMVYGTRIVAITARRKQERVVRRNLVTQIDSIPRNG